MRETQQILCPMYMLSHQYIQRLTLQPPKSLFVRLTFEDVKNETEEPSSKDESAMTDLLKKVRYMLEFESRDTSTTLISLAPTHGMDPSLTSRARLVETKSVLEMVERMTFRSRMAVCVWEKTQPVMVTDRES